MEVLGGNRAFDNEVHQRADSAIERNGVPRSESHPLSWDGV
jgi:hypothetical protein